MKVLFIFPYPSGTAASQRFRFEQYLSWLPGKGISYTLAPFLDKPTWDILYKKGYTLQKAMGIIKGFLRRLHLLVTIRQYDFVFIHREASPVGPPIFEWFMAKIVNKRIIFDFDDAIWLPNTSANNKLAAGFKWHQKTAAICQWAYKVSAGNTYLASYAKQFSTKVFVNPTTIDTVHLHNQVKDQQAGKLVIGWTGTHSTIGYLYGIIPVLQELEKEYDFTFLVISDKAPDVQLACLHYLPWNKETEIADLLRMNIGIMPLTDDKWAKGKCGFKALQYMALGIPALVSPVGVNTEIVDSGINGFICTTNQDWKEHIGLLLQNSSLRIQMGQAARAKVEKHYSVQANCCNFLDFFTA
ncbi:glycosyltransferase family 4 protein [Rhodocytophaga aerolata]|uniref:Glycosyltransferase family 4 protein n=1 Tax=Rhodocytophaga aerolata TaxID=455078 RepID=A0ABT8RAZ5_9BACT|nr:glycosyltransferase family 4 protein [Rhodocytophaga aerolata]MDO1448856.1 glycosyltransferase family 4 protein [Rhodocytophaga aerolata]